MGWSGAGEAWPTMAKLRMSAGSYSFISSHLAALGSPGMNLGRKRSIAREYVGGRTAHLDRTTARREAGGDRNAAFTRQKRPSRSSGDFRQFPAFHGSHE